MPPRKTRSTRSKAETASELNQVRNQVEFTPEVSAQTQEQNKARAVEVRALTIGVTPDSALKKLTETNISVNKALANIGETIQNEVAELNNLREAKTIEIQEIEELHGKEVLAASIKDLLEDFDLKKETMSRDAADEEAEHNRRREQREQKWKDDDAQRTKQQNQEAYDYNYKISQSRAQATDAFNSEIQNNKRAEAIRQEDLKRSWEQREAELKSKETDFANFKKQVEEFPATLAKEIKAAEGKATGIAENRAKHEITLLQKDFDAAKSLSEARIKSLEQTIEQNNVQMAKQATEISGLNARVQSIAEKALESASGQQTLAQMQQFQQNAQNRTGNGKSA